MSKNATRCGQFDGAFLEFGKFQDLQRLGNRKQLVDFKGERTGDVAVSARRLFPASVAYVKLKIRERIRAASIRTTVRST